MERPAARAETVSKLMFLVGAYYFLQAMGGNPGLHAQSLTKFLKESLHYDTAQISAFTFFITIPWMLKPFYGFLSDFVPLFGLRRKSYFIVTGAMAATALLMVSWFPLTSQTLPWLMFAVGMGIAFTDVLTDAVMVEKGQPLNATARLQSAQWTSLYAGGILVAFAKGYIAQYAPLSEAVRFSMVFPGLVIVFTILALRESPVHSSSESAVQAWNGLKTAARSRVLWGAAIFIFLFQCAPHLGNVLYYYEKDKLKFDEITIGHIDTVANISALVGALLFGVVAKRISYNALVRTMIIVGTVGGLLYLFFRDKPSAFAVVGVASMLAMMPFLGVLTIAAKVCPKNAEGSVFALLMAISNLGTQTGGVIGGHLYKVESIGYTGLVIISNACTLLMWLFIPLVREQKAKTNAA